MKHSRNALPAYEQMLRAFRETFEVELQRAIDDLPLCSGDGVIDLGCGDGQYALWLAARVAPAGSVTGVDISQAYLRAARRRAAQTSFGRSLKFVQGNAKRLPFRDDTFDLAWCAQSLYSLPDPVQTLRELARVVRPGGIIAVLEEDTLHHILLPWPIQVELALRQAEFTALAQENPKPSKFYIGRELRHEFQAAGLRPQRKRTYAMHREAPLGHSERKFVDAYLKNLLDRTKNLLPSDMEPEVRRLLDPRSPQYVAARSDFSFTCLEHVMWGKKDR